MAATKRGKILESLQSQLRSRGQDADYAIDQISDYMALWDIKNQLIRDIKKRGITYQERTATGVEQTRNNPSTKELLGVNKQMLQLLKDLDLNTESWAADQDDAL